MRVGSRAWFGGFARAQESQVIDEVVEAATELARHRIGALITFEQDANLDEFVGGTRAHVVDAAVDARAPGLALHPRSREQAARRRGHHPQPAHRQGRRLLPDARAAASSIASFGSRHRAALGITEETDAVVVVVSEERGTISFCFNGNIVSNLDGPKLRHALEGVFSPRLAKKRARKAKRESQRSSAAETPVPESVVHVRLSEIPPVPTPVDEPTPTTRIRTEPEIEKRDSEPPAPLRKAKAETEVEEAATAATAITRPSIHTPLRASSAAIPEATRPMPRAGTDAIRTHDDTVPDSEERGDT